MCIVHCDMKFDVKVKSLYAIRVLSFDVVISLGKKHTKFSKILILQGTNSGGNLPTSYLLIYSITISYNPGLINFQHYFPRGV